MQDCRVSIGDECWYNGQNPSKKVEGKMAAQTSKQTGMAPRNLEACPPFSSPEKYRNATILGKLFHIIMDIQGNYPINILI